MLFAADHFELIPMLGLLLQIFMFLILRTPLQILQSLRTKYHI